jgi:ketosteroid isomerase-like protein
MSTRRSLLREMYLAGDAGQLELFNDLLHDDVVVHAPFGLSTMGLGAEKASWQQALAAMHDLRHELLDVLVDNDMESARCVVTGTLHGTYGGISGGGKPFAVDQAVFARIRDGRIAELWEIVDTDSLLRQMREPAS